MKNTLLSTVLATGIVGSMLGLSSMATAADFSAVPSGKYNVDPVHAYVTFSYDHLGLSNPVLAFEEFDIELNLDKDEPTNSTIKVVINAASIVGGSDIWNEHLNGEKYFDTAKNPEITFTSTSVEAARDGNYSVMGDLTIKGMSKPVTLDVVVNAAIEHPMSGNPTIGIQATSEIMRSEFGFNAGIPNVGDAIALQVTAELNQKK